MVFFKNLRAPKFSGILINIRKYKPYISEIGFIYNAIHGIPTQILHVKSISFFPSESVRNTQRTESTTDTKDRKFTSFKNNMKAQSRQCGGIQTSTIHVLRCLLMLFNHSGIRGLCTVSIPISYQMRHILFFLKRTVFLLSNMNALQYEFQFSFQDA